MYKDYFDVLKTAIKQGLNAVKTVDWYNQQYDRYEELKANAFPAVYIEFENPITWTDGANGMQFATTSITFHLVVFDVGDSPEGTLSLANDLHKLLHNFRIMDEDKQLSTELVRVSSSLETGYDQIKIVQLQYATTLFDETTMKELVSSGNVGDCKEFCVFGNEKAEICTII